MTMNGERCVIKCGAVLMPEWSVGNSSLQLKVYMLMLIVDKTIYDILHFGVYA